MKRRRRGFSRYAEWSATPCYLWKCVLTWGALSEPHVIFRIGKLTWGDFSAFSCQYPMLFAKMRFNMGLAGDFLAHLPHVILMIRYLTWVC